MSAHRALSPCGCFVQIGMLRRELATSKRQEVLAIAKAEGLRREVWFAISQNNHVKQKLSIVVAKTCLVTGQGGGGWIWVKNVRILVPFGTLVQIVTRPFSNQLDEKRLFNFSTLYLCVSNDCAAGSGAFNTSIRAWIAESTRGDGKSEYEACFYYSNYIPGGYSCCLTVSGPYLVTSSTCFL